MGQLRKLGFLGTFTLLLMGVLLLGETIQVIEEACSKLREGKDSLNEKLLKEARGIFINALLKEGKDNSYLLYYLGLSDYRLTTFYIATDNNKKAKQYLEEGKKYLEKAQKTDASFGESYALYASLLGIEIQIDSFKAYLGPKINEYYSKAFEREPQNPRINLLRGISLLYTPKLFGGGANKAKEYLEKSIHYFEKETEGDSLKPKWGKEEAFTYLGISYKELGEFKKAKEVLNKALEINPNYEYAKIELNTIKEE